ncbi:formyl transferase [Neisseria flavescens SK114]|nr:formyl transferase [Neisseria flavescens SK114]
MAVRAQRLWVMGCCPICICDSVYRLECWNRKGLEFCAHYENRLINIHPSILPSFTGLHTHERALEAGCRVAGCTIHFVTPELDCGPIISQGIVPILDGDTADDVAARVLTVEHQLFPQAVADFVAGRLKIEGNRVLNAQRNAAGQSLLA